MSNPLVEIVAADCCAAREYGHNRSVARHPLAAGRARSQHGFQIMEFIFCRVHGDGRWMIAVVLNGPRAMLRATSPKRSADEPPSQERQSIAVPVD
jgi:hypothetical protein